MADKGGLRISFSLRGLDGVIVVALTVNTDPASLGYSLLFEGEPLDAARGFPVCRAGVAYGWLCGYVRLDADGALYRQCRT